jgi:hypothetical protein
MNLQENIHRIHQMMGVISEDKKEDAIRTIIDKMGVANAIKMTGNYYMIEPYLKVVDKVNFIKEKVAELSELVGDVNIDVYEIGEEPIDYEEEDGEIHQIESLGKKSVDISIYDEEFEYLRDYYVKYENLPVEVIERLVEMLLKH